MATTNFVYVGLKGTVVALDRATGSEVWITPLRGGEFVNVALSESELYAATKGELFCLDPATGHVRWHNPLKGLGRGLIAIAAAGVETNQMSLLERRKREEQAAAAAAAAGASS